MAGSKKHAKDLKRVYRKKVREQEKRKNAARQRRPFIPWPQSFDDIPGMR